MTPFSLPAAKAITGYWYVATPYTLFDGGIELAFEAACRVTAALIRLGVPVFSPIAHSHPIAVHGGIDPRDHNIWLPADAPLMAAAHGLIVAALPRWQESRGVAHEIAAFEAAGKPVVLFYPDLAEALA